MRLRDESQFQENTNKEVRRLFLINPKFQLSFMSYTIAIAFVTIALFFAADLYFFYKFRQIGIEMGLARDHVFFQFLGEQEASKNWIYLLASVVSLIGLSTWGLIISHRVAGPLYRLNKHFGEVARGETMDDVRFRDGDYFQELSEGFNQQMKRYRELSDQKESPKTDDQSRAA